MMLARCMSSFTRGFDKFDEQLVWQSVKMHCQTVVVNFVRKPYNEYIDLKTATALAWSLMNILNTCEKGRCQISKLIEHGPLQKSCDFSRLFWRSEGLSRDIFKLRAASWNSPQSLITLQRSRMPKGVVRDVELTSQHPAFEDVAFHWQNKCLATLPHVLW